MQLCACVCKCVYALLLSMWLKRLSKHDGYESDGPEWLFESHCVVTDVSAVRIY